MLLSINILNINYRHIESNSQAKWSTLVDWILVGILQQAPLPWKRSDGFWIFLSPKEFKFTYKSLPFKVNLNEKNCCARSVLPRPREYIPQYGPRTRLVRRWYYLSTTLLSMISFLNAFRTIKSNIWQTKTSKPSSIKTRRSKLGST